MAKTLLPWYENLAVGAGLQGGWSLQLPFLVRTSDLTLRHGGGSVSFEPVATQTVSFVVLSSRSSDISINIYRIPRRLARTKSNKIKLVYFGSSFCVTQYDFFRQTEVNKIWFIAVQSGGSSQHPVYLRLHSRPQWPHYEARLEDCRALGLEELLSTSSFYFCSIPNHFEKKSFDLHAALPKSM